MFSPATGITANSQKLTKVGKVAQLELYISHSAQWTVGNQYNVGTIASAYRPVMNCAGVIGTFGVAAALADGSTYARPLANVELAANNSSYVRFTYLLS